MPFPALRPFAFAMLALLAAPVAFVVPAAAQTPDLIFKKSTVFRLLTWDDKLATYAIDDPDIEGVACHYTVPEKGGVAGGWALRKRFRISLSPAGRSGRSSSRTRPSRGK